MLTDFISHIKSTRLAFLTVKEDISNLWGHTKALNQRLANIESSLESINRRLDSLEFDAKVPQKEFIEVPKTEYIEVPKTKIVEVPVPEKKLFIANTDSGKLHEEGCVFAKKILPEHKVVLESIEGASLKGYKPCVCLEA